MITKAQIIELLAANDKAVIRALLVLNERQTTDEQNSETTRYLNQRGFSAAHAKRGTGMAKFYLERGFLSTKQIQWWRVPARGGQMRIAMYAGQLLEAAETKAANRAKFANTTPITRDDDTTASPDHWAEIRRLQYEIGMVQDSDDPTLIEPLQNELDEFMRKVQKQY
jgi:hypothetical protein